MEPKGLKRHYTRPPPRQRAYIDLCVRLMVVLSLMGILFAPRPKVERPYMPTIEVLDKSLDACAASVNSPKVALLFLTRGDLHHEPAWRLWLRSASGIFPLSVATDEVGALCSLDETAFAEAHEACNPNRIKNTNDAIASQHLFNVYVHLSAEVDESALSPLWRPHVVQHRVSTEWGTHSLVEASRSLLWEAFKDPLNQRFVLISESDIPIWDPLTFYFELMAERRSKVDAWWHPNVDAQRWSWRMALSGARIRRSDWRKSAQWFSLIRSHVQVALQDEVLFSAFAEHCRSSFDGDYGKWRECFSDEHYLPTLLHMKGLEEETVPSPLGITAADWSEENPHPHEYRVDEIDANLFTTRLRNNSDCPSIASQHRAVQEAARQYFVSIESALSPLKRNALCSHISSDGDEDSDVANGPELNTSPSLPSGCYLLARKFPVETADSLYQVFKNCSNGLMLVGDAACERASQIMAENPVESSFAAAGEEEIEEEEDNGLP